MATSTGPLPAAAAVEPQLNGHARPIVAPPLFTWYRAPPVFGALCF